MEKINIVVAGDYAPQNRVQKKIDCNECEDVLRDVRPIIKSADYSIVNFECSIPSESDSKISKCGPHLKTSIHSLKLLNNTGFDCISLANNHIRDYGNGGIANIINNCGKYQLDYVGAGINIEDSRKILYKRIKNKTLAFISICEVEFTIATDTSSGAAPIDIIDNYNQIKEAKQRADYIIMIVHGGPEHFQLPSLRMVKTYRFFIDMGVDVVINHHQHCYNGYEVYKNKPIFYGLGNFCFDKPKFSNSIWNEGYMVELSLTSNNIGYKLHPYEQCNNNARVTLLADRSKFDNHIEEINAIINDHEMLKEHLDKYLILKGKAIFKDFEPYNNRVLRYLARKSLLPSFMNKYKKLLISHYISCESHRDKLLAYLRSLE